MNALNILFVSASFLLLPQLTQAAQDLNTSENTACKVYSNKGQTVRLLGNCSVGETYKMSTVQNLTHTEKTQTYIETIGYWEDQGHQSGALSNVSRNSEFWSDDRYQ